MYFTDAQDVNINHKWFAIVIVALRNKSFCMFAWHGRETCSGSLQRGACLAARMLMGQKSCVTTGVQNVASVQQ